MRRLVVNSGEMFHVVEYAVWFCSHVGPELFCSLSLSLPHSHVPRFMCLLDSHCARMRALESSKQCLHLHVDLHGEDVLTLSSPPH